MTTEEKQNKSTGEAEYQYPNEEYVTETTPPEEGREPPESRFGFITRFIQNNKRVTLVVAIAIIALVAFKIMSPHHTTAVVAKAAPVMQEPVAPLAAAVPSSQSPDVADALSSLKQEAQTNQTQVGQLQGQISDLRNQLVQANTSQNQLNQSMLALVEQLKALTSEVHQAPLQKPADQAPPPPPMVFHLKAVVPGRAWIVSNDGLSESVSVGDSVPQYGTVNVVDANRGMVLTSSGKVIGYGENDR